MELREGDELVVEITAIDHMGRGLLQYDNKTMHVPDAIPGNRVRVRIIRRRATSYVAEVISMEE